MRLECSISGDSRQRASRVYVHRVRRGLVSSPSNPERASDRVHGESKEFDCEVCHKSFSKRWDLFQHMNIHTKDKPYRCKKCHECFTQGSALKQHQKIHRGDRQHECELCNEAFYHSSNLRAHMRVHT
ncbi:PREDICTED: zinc finger protein 154-like, partial [Priapulus caudatus]|uniref:Zinc finger protein 154-like n=1 Tax=Priapulus caudatus TaxID=37621 RepID=A0ABM1F673_PRICU